MAEKIWLLLPESFRRWSIGLLVGAILGGGGSTAFNYVLPDSGSRLVQTTMAKVEGAVQAIADRVEAVEKRIEGHDTRFDERGRIIDANSARISNIETRLSGDVREIKETAVRLEAKVDQLIMRLAQQHGSE